MAGPHSYEANDQRKGTKVIDLDCRGLEFTEFKADVRYVRLVLCGRLHANVFVFQGDWEAKGIESGSPFSGIDLSEGEWYDYDEKAGDEVSIKEISWTVGRS